MRRRGRGMILNMGWDQAETGMGGDSGELFAASKGAVMAITAYLPLIGAGLVWVPAAMYFGVQGAYGRMWVLIAAGIGIAVIDYLVRNIVVGEASKLHSLIMFFSVIGRIEFFGLVGIVAGPMIVAVAEALLETYRSEQAALFTTTAVEPREKRIPHDGGVGC